MAAPAAPAPPPNSGFWGTVKGVAGVLVPIIVKVSLIAGGAIGGIVLAVKSTEKCIYTSSVVSATVGILAISMAFGAGYFGLLLYIVSPSTDD